jgi:hypothetical protein
MTLSQIRWKPLCEKKLAGPTQHTATAPNFLISHTRGRHLRYLIGQQRSQSSPPAISKSSVNIRHRRPQKGTKFLSSLCNLCVLCVSVVDLLSGIFQPQRHRERRGCTEKHNQATYEVLMCFALFVAPAPAPAPVALMTLG